MEEVGTLETEEAFLGGLVYDKNNYEEIIGKIVSDDFLSEEHQNMFVEIGNFLGEGYETVTGTMFLTYLKDHKRLKACGGDNEITKLFSYEPLPDEFHYYLEQVKNKGAVRRLFKEYDYQKQVFDQNAQDDTSSFLARAQERVKAITDGSIVGNIKDMKEILDNVQKKALKDSETRKKLKLIEPWLTGNSCGYEDIDKLTMGFHAGDYILMAARPSVGKTTLALNMACRMGLRGIPVCIFSLEMSQEQLGMKLLSMQCKLTTFEINSIMTGKDTDYTRKSRLETAYEQLAQAPIYMDDTDPSLDSICAKVRKARRKYPDLGMVVIDYIGLIRNSGNKSYNRQNEVSDISRSLKLLANETQVPMLVLSQMSRGVETRTNHTPVLADLRDSGSLEQDADMVFFIYREDYYDQQKENTAGSYINQNPDYSSVKLLLEKNRNGSLGTVEMGFTKSISSFEALAKNQKEREE